MALSRRGSLLAAVGMFKHKSHEIKGKAAGGPEGRQRLANIKETGVRLVLDLADLPQPRDGEVFYRTLRIYPAVPVHPQECFIIINRPPEMTTSPAGRRRLERAENEGRKGGGPVREDTLTPPTEEPNRW